MRVITVDPGYDRIGIAILEKKEQREVILFSECFTTNKNQSINERIFSATERIRFLIKEYSPSYFVIEKLFFSKNTKTALAVSEARGSFIYLAYSLGIPVYEFTPNQIKLALTGNGNATKNDMNSFIPKLVSMEDRKYIDDEIDAIAIALTFYSQFNLLVKYEGIK